MQKEKPKVLREMSERDLSYLMTGAKTILLIDMDGVAANWDGQLHQELSEVFPRDEIPHPTEWTGYMYENSVDEKYHPAAHKIIHTKGFYRRIKPYPEAIACLKDMEINCRGFIEPYICTKPSAEYEDALCHSEKVQWVKEHLGTFWIDRTILAPDKTLIIGDYLLDDHPRIRGVNPNPTWTQLVLDKPYNKDAKGIRMSWADWPLLKEILNPYKLS